MPCVKLGLWDGSNSCFNSTRKRASLAATLCHSIS